MDRQARLDVSGKLFLGTDVVDNQPPTPKLPAGLIEKIEAIDDEVEFWNGLFLPKIVGEVMNIVEGQSRLPTTLCVPDDAFADSLIDFLGNRLGGEYLGVPHDVFLDTGFSPHIGDPIAEEEGQAITG